MKQFFKILALAALALPFTGCDVEYSDINILPDPVFEQNGLYTVNTISIYDDYETVINVSRTAGLSKELELDIVVDETLLAEYNELYNTDYKLLEAQFYDIPKNAQLASTVKSVDISVRIHPKALIAAKGMAAANNMLLPIRISNASTPVEDGGSMMQALLRLNIVEPIVQVEMPEQMPQLEFIPTIPLPQEITLNATANFNTLEVAKIGYRVNASKVDAYNEEHGTSYQLLPEQYYKIKESDFDTETLEIESRIEFDCAAIGGEGTYLLPLEMHSDDYSVVQREPVYVLIQMSELKIWVTNAADLAKTSGKGKIRVQMNSPMTVGQPVDFVFEPEKVETYNTEHGTAFKTLDAAKVVVTPTEIQAGSQYGELSFELDLSELDYDRNRPVDILHRGEQDAQGHLRQGSLGRRKKQPRFETGYFHRRTGRLCRVAECEEAEVHHQLQPDVDRRPDLLQYFGRNGRRTSQPAGTRRFLGSSQRKS